MMTGKAVYRLSKQCLLISQKAGRGNPATLVCMRRVKKLCADIFIKQGFRDIPDIEFTGECQQNSALAKMTDAASRLLGTKGIACSDRRQRVKTMINEEMILWSKMKK